MLECPACFNVDKIDRDSKQCPKCGCYFYGAQLVIDAQPCYPQHQAIATNIFLHKGLRRGGVVPKVAIKDYKGNPVICIPLNEMGQFFSFGLRKAQAILEHLNEIQGFVDKEEKERAEKRKGLDNERT